MKSRKQSIIQAGTIFEHEVELKFIRFQQILNIAGARIEDLELSTKECRKAFKSRHFLFMILNDNK